MNHLSHLPLRCRPLPFPLQQWCHHLSLNQTALRSKIARFPHLSALSGWPGLGRLVQSTHLFSLPATPHRLDREAFGHLESAALQVRASFATIKTETGLRIIWSCDFVTAKAMFHWWLDEGYNPLHVVTEAMSGWSQPLMGSHMMHPQLQAEQSAFSQHQPMEQDDTGIANPANSYHQPQHLPNSYMDYPKVTQSQRSGIDLTCLLWKVLIFTSCSFRGCLCQCMEEPCCPLILP